MKRRMPLYEPDGGSSGSASFDELLKNKDVKDEFDKRLATAKEEWIREQEEEKNAPGAKAMAEVAKLKAQLARKDLEDYTRTCVADNKLPTLMSKWLTGQDEQESKANVEEFASIFNEALSEARKQAVTGRSPATADPNRNEMSLEDELTSALFGHIN